MISHLYKDYDFYKSEITRVNFTKPKWRLNGRGLFFMGSCFAKNLYSVLEATEINTKTSPFGNIYNPSSMLEAAEYILKREEILEKDCIFNDGYFYNFLFHSQKKEKTSKLLAKKLNKEIALSQVFLKDAEAVILTFGTSLVYRLNKDFSDNFAKGQTVSNCHKLHSSNFNRKQLAVNEAENAICKTIEAFKKINPDIKIILTLSPVRHLRDDATENSLSKAVLRSAIDGALQNPNVWYFPAYEIMLDELRDYRWYADDLCHPSNKAVEYIISIFLRSVYNPLCLEYFDKWFRLQLNLNHKPRNPDSVEYKKMLEKTFLKLNRLKDDYDFLKK